MVLRHSSEAAGSNRACFEYCWTGNETIFVLLSNFQEYQGHIKINDLALGCLFHQKKEGHRGIEEESWSYLWYLWR